MTLTVIEASGHLPFPSALSIARIRLETRDRLEYREKQFLQVPLFMRIVNDGTVSVVPLSPDAASVSVPPAFHERKYGTFRSASENCFVSQPTLSGQLRKLEDEHGHPLFERSIPESGFFRRKKKLKFCRNSF